MKHTKETGFYLVQKRWTKVHGVIDGKPLCRRRTYRTYTKGKEFVWMGDGFKTAWIDCANCIATISNFK